MVTKIASWNVNGFRSLLKTNEFHTFLANESPSILCLSETKLTPESMETLPPFNDTYKYKYWNHSTTTKGHSGTAVWLKRKPIRVEYSPFDTEGRIITVELSNYYLINVYVPNAGNRLQRLNYRLSEWDQQFYNYVQHLQQHKPVIIAGDLNVAHTDLDIYSTLRKNKIAGFTPEERQQFHSFLLTQHFIDTYRYLHPSKKEYSFWSYRNNSREKNNGWRLDYILVSSSLEHKLKKATICTNYHGSDHVPIMLELT